MEHLGRFYIAWLKTTAASNTEQVVTTTASGGQDSANCVGQCNHALATCSVSTEAPGYVCNCPLGYQWSNDACEDVNECLTDTTTCTGAYMCVNLIGSMTCGCAVGYEQDLQTNECVDSDECANGTSGCEQVTFIVKTKL